MIVTRPPWSAAQPRIRSGSESGVGTPAIVSVAAGCLAARRSKASSISPGSPFARRHSPKNRIRSIAGRFLNGGRRAARRCHGRSPRARSGGQPARTARRLCSPWTKTTLSGGYSRRSNPSSAGKRSDRRRKPRRLRGRGSWQTAAIRGPRGIHVSASAPAAAGATLVRRSAARRRIALGRPPTASGARPRRNPSPRSAPVGRAARVRSAARSPTPCGGREDRAHPDARNPSGERLVLSGGDQLNVVPALGQRAAERGRVVEETAARGALDHRQPHARPESRGCSPRPSGVVKYPGVDRESGPASSPLAPRAADRRRDARSGVRSAHPLGDQRRAVDRTSATRGGGDGGRRGGRSRSSLAEKAASFSLDLERWKQRYNAGASPLSPAMRPLDERPARHPAPPAKDPSTSSCR